MNPTLSQRLRPALPWLLLAAFALNFARGLTPFVMVEGDEQGVLNGVRELARGQPDPRWMYLYPVQAGSYEIIRALVALGVPSPDMAFGFATVLGGIGCMVGAAWLGVRLLNVPWIIATLWVCAIPEMSSACFYLNTSSVAGPFAWAALLVACGRASLPRAIVTGVLLGLGGWVRVDALGLAPGVLLLWWRFDRANAIRATAMAAAVSAIVLGLLWAACGVGVREAAEIWSGREVTHPFGEAMRITLLALGPAMFGLVFVALWRLVRRREWWWILFAVATTGPTLVAHGHFLTTPKYLYFCLPVLGLIGLGAVRDGWHATGPAARIAAAVAVALIAFDWFSSMRTWAPERQRFKLSPPLATIARADIGGIDVRWVLGHGELIWTDDSYRARGGYWFAPMRWHEDKTAMVESRAQLAAFAQQPAPFGLVTCGWVPRQAVVATLLEAGFTAGPARLDQPGDLSDYTQDWTAPDGRTCRQVALSVFGQELMPRMISVLAGRETLFVTDESWRPKNDSAINWSPLPGPDDGLVVTLHARLAP